MSNTLIIVIIILLLLISSYFGWRMGRDKLFKKYGSALSLPFSIWQVVKSILMSFLIMVILVIIVDLVFKSEFMEWVALILASTINTFIVKSRIFNEYEIMHGAIDLYKEEQRKKNLQ